MKQSMDILIVEPGKAPRPTALPDNTLEAVEAASVRGHGTGGVFPAAEGTDDQQGGCGWAGP